MFEPPPTDLLDVQRELEALRAELAEIRRVDAEGWVDQARAEQVQGIVRDVLADSSTRLSESGKQWRSAYSAGLSVTSDDGNWTMNFGVTQQVKFVYSSAYGDESSTDDVQTRWGMEIRRVNLVMSGTAVDPSVSWLLMFQYDSQPDRWSDNPGTFQPVYAYIKKDFGGGVNVLVGNHNVPWDIDSSYFEGCSLTAGDYSIFNYRFGVGREVGISMQLQDNSFRLRAGTYSQLTMPDGQWNADTNLSFAVAGRLEYQVGGKWEDYELESSMIGTDPSVVLGLASVWSNGRADNPTSPVTPSAAGITTDVTARFGGWSLEGQFVWMRDAAGAPIAEWSLGGNFQIAAFVAPKIETFAEACWMETADVPWIAQAGFNWYVDGARLKFTCKAIVPFGGGEINGIGQVAGGLGVSSANNNVSLISQVQMMF
jgi:hypothetical protein